MAAAYVTVRDGENDEPVQVAVRKCKYILSQTRHTSLFRLFIYLIVIVLEVFKYITSRLEINNKEMSVKGIIT